MSFLSKNHFGFVVSIWALCLMGWSGAASADYGLCVNWYSAFGLPSGTFERTPGGTRQNLVPQTLSVTGRITRLDIGSSISVGGNPSLFNQRHITRNYLYTKYGTEVRGPVLVELNTQPGKVFALRLLNEGNCGLSESARLEALQGAFANNELITITYLTITPFEYAWDADDDGFVFNTHVWGNGMILGVSRVRTRSRFWYFFFG